MPTPAPRLTKIVHSVGRDWKARSLVADACTVGINVYRPTYQLATRLNPKRAIQAVSKLGLQQDADYEKRWTDELGTLLET